MDTGVRPAVHLYCRVSPRQLPLSRPAVHLYCRVSPRQLPPSRPAVHLYCRVSPWQLHASVASTVATLLPSHQPALAPTMLRSSPSPLPATCHPPHRRPSPPWGPAPSNPYPTRSFPSCTNQRSTEVSAGVGVCVTFELWNFVMCLVYKYLSGRVTIYI